MILFLTTYRYNPGYFHRFSRLQDRRFRFRRCRCFWEASNTSQRLCYLLPGIRFDSIHILHITLVKKGNRVWDVRWLFRWYTSTVCLAGGWPGRSGWLFQCLRYHCSHSQLISWISRPFSDNDNKFDINIVHMIARVLYTTIPTDTSNGKSHWANRYLHEYWESIDIEWCA